MFQEGCNDDSVWDELDEAAIEECIMIENEVLSQIPTQLPKCKDNMTTTSSSNLKIPDNKNKNSPFINNSFNDFRTKCNNPVSSCNTNSANNTSKNNKYGKIPFEVKTPSSFRLTSCPSSASVYSKDNKYALKDVKEKSHIENPTEELKRLQKEVELANQEKEKLREENQIKEGEVYNLRLELKRKESCLEAERIDQCIALDAAEKRGKDKASKAIAELELKTKALQREVDRIQGNLGFKSREIEELLVKCRQLEQIQSTSLASKKLECSPVKKKRNASPNGSKFSPTKFSTNFSDRFDFGGRKEKTKDVEVQTDKCSEKMKRPSIKVLSSRGCTRANRKAFYISIAMQEIVDGSYLFEGELSHKVLRKTNPEDHSTLLAQMTFTQNSTHSGTPGTAAATLNCEHLLVNSACNKLEQVLQNINQESTVRNAVTNEDTNMDGLCSNSIIPIFTILSMSNPADETSSHKAIRLISLYLLSVPKEESSVHRTISAGLDSLSFLAPQCSVLPLQLCEALGDSLKHCCLLSSNRKYIRKLFSTLNILMKFGNFQSQMCKSLNELWHRVLCGIRVLYSWQLTDVAWWEKTSNLPSYAALISSLINKFKELKAVENMDQNTLDILYDLYEADENSMCL